MVKIIIIALIVILILGAVAFSVVGGVLPWFVTQGDSSIASVATPGLEEQAPSITENYRNSDQPTETPAAVIPTPTALNDQLITTPACFTIQDLPAFAFSPDSTQIMVRIRSGVQIFDVLTGSLEAFIKSSQDVTAAALSPDGKVLAWTWLDGTIQLIDLSSQAILANLIGHPDPAIHIQFSPTGDKLISASHDGLVRIWGLDGKQLSEINAGGEVVGFGISADGSKLATIPFDGPVVLWDLSTNTEIRKLGGSGGYDTSSASFSPDGQYLAADLAVGIFLWRISDGSLVWNQVNNSMAVSFSPDGQYLAYSDIGDSNKVTLAAPDTGQMMRVIDQMGSPVWELLFSPDASLLAITDGVEIHIWQVEDEVLLSVGKASCP